MPSRTKHCPACGQHYDAAALFCQRDGAPLRDGRPSLAPDMAEGEALLGHVLLDQFRLDAVLGAGGMGTVYRARQLGCERDVAVKILHPEVARNAEAARRFEREARVSAQITHPNVVDVLLFGRLGDGRSYLVMEYLPGRALADLLDETPRLAPARALRLLCQLADGLGAAHRRGVVHRDVKPENVIVRDPGLPGEWAKLLDFGVARCLWGEHTMATETGLVFGTARYMSPEGAAGETTDARSDVYALGVLAWQLLAGRLPFDAESPVSLLLLHVHEAPPPLPGDVPRPVADVVMRALAKSPSFRPADGDAFSRALRVAAARAGLALEGAPADAGPHRASPAPARAASASYPTLLEADLAHSDPLSVPVAAAANRPAPTALGPAASRSSALRSSAPRSSALRSSAPRSSALRSSALRSSAPRSSAPAPAPTTLGSAAPPPAPPLPASRASTAPTEPPYAPAYATPWAPAGVARRGPPAALVWISAFVVGAATVGVGAWALGALERTPAPGPAAAGPAAAPVDEPAPAPVQPGVRVEPSTPVAGRPVTLVAVLDPDAPVAAASEGRFRLVHGGRDRAVDVVAAHAVAGGGFAASATFPRAGDWRVVFEIPLAPGGPSETLTASVDVPVGSPPRPAVVRRRPARRAPARDPAPTPRTVPAADEAPTGGIRWELSPAVEETPTEPSPERRPGRAQEPAPPPPWTSEGADLL